MKNLKMFMHQISDAVRDGHEVVSIESGKTSKGVFIYALDSTGSVLASANLGQPEESREQLEMFGSALAAVAIGTTNALQELDL